MVQTEGRKRWWLYAPLDGFALPSTHSNDLSEDAIGEPTMECTLEVFHTCPTPGRPTSGLSFLACCKYPSMLC